MKNKVFGFFWILGSVQNFLLRGGVVLFGKSASKKCIPPPRSLHEIFVPPPWSLCLPKMGNPPPKGARIFPGQQGRFSQKPGNFLISLEKNSINQVLINVQERQTTCFKALLIRTTKM